MREPLEERDLASRHPFCTPRARAAQVATGCDGDACSAKEVQVFTCKADSGAFAFELYEGGVARNIDAHADQGTLKAAIETIAGVENVTVPFPRGPQVFNFEVCRRGSAMECV